MLYLYYLYKLFIGTLDYSSNFVEEALVVVLGVVDFVVAHLDKQSDVLVVLEQLYLGI